MGKHPVTACSAVSDKDQGRLGILQMFSGVLGTLNSPPRIQVYTKEM